MYTDDKTTKEGIKVRRNLEIIHQAAQSLCKCEIQTTLKQTWTSKWVMEEKNEQIQVPAEGIVFMMIPQ